MATPFGDRQPEEPRAVGDRGGHAPGRRASSARVRAREQRRHRGGGDGLGRRDLAQDGHEAVVAGEAAQDEVGAHDRGAGRGRGRRGRRGRDRRAPARGRVTRDGASVGAALARGAGRWPATASPAATSTDASPVGVGRGRGAGVPSGPAAGEQAATASDEGQAAGWRWVRSAVRMAGSSVRVPKRRQHRPRRVIAAHRPEVTIRSRGGSARRPCRRRGGRGPAASRRGAPRARRRSRGPARSCRARRDGSAL